MKKISQGVGGRIAVAIRRQRARELRREDAIAAKQEAREMEAKIFIRTRFLFSSRIALRLIPCSKVRCRPKWSTVDVCGQLSDGERGKHVVDSNKS